MKKWVPAILIILAVVTSLYFYPSLPERMPTHWGISGEANGWSSRLWGAWMLPLLMAVMWLFFRALPHIDPRKRNYQQFMGYYELFIAALLAFLLVMHIVVLEAATGVHVPIKRVAISGMGAFFLLMGVVLPRIKPNWFIGVRTPWTLSSDLSWQRTHHVAGTMFIGVGIIAILATLLVPDLALWALFGAAGVTIVFLLIYSYRVWKEDPARRSA